ncbi:MAG: FKBP-type peptidyl-prolyl cis-trans isomerase [Bacteroidales bacterium]|nr:FKBP-type peptidyl-prolyl cis-trans isomerase [Bacteroidales bacterium]MBN2818085.1 FKBP-type peptidyl-prolyl cis-trans isomerase [Bacteroidales bacterium]
MAKRDKKDRNRGSSGFNRKTGEDYLSRNRNKEGICETSSGLQYKIIETGEGDSPSENAYIVVNQRCQLVNGTILEDTYKENTPSEVKMEELIEGYREGIMLMNKGARFRLYVPPELGWGKKGTGNKIPPNAVLIFDVRLVDFW